MKFNLIAFFSILIALSIIDFFTYLIFRKEVKPSKFTKVFSAIFFWSSPIIFASLFLYITIFIRSANSPSMYTALMCFTGSWLLVYVPKIGYLLYYSILIILNKVTDVFRKKKESRDITTIRYPKIARRKFLSQLGIIFATAPFISVLFGIVKGRFNFHKKHTTLGHDKVPASFDGFKIVQLSDMHLGSFSSDFHKLEEVVELINEENPDLILFTGDLVNNFAEETLGWERIFTKMKARCGKFSVLGNHDYGDYSNWETKEARQENFQGIVDAHERFGFKLLRNQSVTIDSLDEKIALSGVENWGKPPFPQYADLDKTLSGIEDVDFKILMSHDPDHWKAEILPKTDYDLTLSGHTHGMQFGINWGGFKWSPAKFKYDYWDGLYSNNDNRYIYVNRGLGYLGMPARIGMPPEITVITLRRTA